MNGNDTTGGLIFSDPDQLVILSSLDDPLTKTHEMRVGVRTSRSYEEAWRFRFRARPATSINALAALLEHLEGGSHSAAVRAAVTPGTDLSCARRRLHAQLHEPATLADVPRRHVALDIDNVPAPRHAPLDWVHDIAGAYRECLQPLLSPEFQEADCVVQATGWAGLKEGLRCRVWFLTEEPHASDELQRTFGKPKWLDCSTLYPATLIYTARPIFIGMLDPVPVRTVVVEGKRERVAVKVPSPVVQAPPPMMRPPIERVWGPKPAYSRAALDNACNRIMRAGDKEQHPRLFREAAGIGSLVGSGHMPVSLARDFLIAAGLSMTSYGRPWHRDEVARQIDRGLAAGMQHPRIPGAA